MWIQVSENDNGPNALRKPPQSGDRQLPAGKILKDKGYAYQLVHSKGAGHAQREVINNCLPQALEFVWLDYVPRR